MSLITESQQILSTLYERYYQEDQTPGALVSSHWRAMHTKAQVHYENGRVKPVFAEGFGDLQVNSWPYRFFSKLNIYIHFFFLQKKASLFHVYKIAKNICRRLGISMTINCFYQVCTAALLMRTLSPKGDLCILNIGDGYGFLSILLKEIYPKAKIVLVDLGKTLLFQVEFCYKAHPFKKHALFFGKDGQEIENMDFIYCPADDLALIDALKFDLMINVVSMQEMNYATIQSYFDFMRSHAKTKNFFYCCNRIEKKLVGGETIRMDAYPWVKEDKHVIDEICPWRRFLIYHRKISERGLTFGKWRVLFISYMDGDIKHRLTILKAIV